MSEADGSYVDDQGFVRDEDGNSAAGNRQGEAHQRPTEQARANADGDNTFRQKRRDNLKRHGLWKSYGAVPPAEQRDEPIETYLPGGENYEEPDE